MRSQTDFPVRILASFGVKNNSKIECKWTPKQVWNASMREIALVRSRGEVIREIALVVVVKQSPQVCM